MKRKEKKSKDRNCLKDLHLWIRSKYTHLVLTCSTVFSLSFSFSVHCLLLSLHGHNIDGLLRSQVSGTHTQLSQSSSKTKTKTTHKTSLSIPTIYQMRFQNKPQTLWKKIPFFFNLLIRFFVSPIFSTNQCALSIFSSSRLQIWRKKITQKNTQKSNGIRS